MRGWAPTSARAGACDVACVAQPAELDCHLSRVHATGDPTAVQPACCHAVCTNVAYIETSVSECFDLIVVI